MISLMVLGVTSATYTQTFHQPTSISGSTALTGFDQFHALCFSPTDTLLHCTFLPAAFGNIQFSESAILVNVPVIEAPLLLSAQTAGGWVHSSVSSLLLWHPVEKLRLGVQPILSYMYAYSLLSKLSAGIRLAGNVRVDSVYSVALAVNNINIFGARRAQQGIGIQASVSATTLNYKGSVDLVLRPQQQLQVLFECLANISPNCNARVQLGTNPIMIGVAVQLYSSSTTICSIGFQHFEQLGFSPTITIEFYP